MPFDDRELPAALLPDRASALHEHRWVAVWLSACAAMIFVMVVLGGATRLTGSGLSIMEWAPVTGVLPPLSAHEWDRLFGLYKGIPQFELLHAGFSVADFKRIFWLEWVHRLWGRAVGAVFFLPLVWFVARGMIERRLLPRLGILLLLGALQGAVGWFMVASGFRPDSTAVSAYRLVAHLGLAVALYAAIVWMALSAWETMPRPQAPRLLRVLAGGTLASVGVTILAGGFVAGIHAGLDYNTFPLMAGHLVPSSYAALQPFARNLFENVAAVQFDHRLLATVTALLAAASVIAGLTSRGRSRATIRAFVVLGAAVAVQYAIGVATLLAIVPVGLAVAHQASAMLLLTASLMTCHAVRHSEKGSSPRQAVS